MKHVHVVVSLLMLVVISLAEADNQSNWIRKEDLPQTDQEWVSFHRTVEFLPASDDLSATAKARALARQLEEEDEGEEEDTATDDIYSIQPFVEGISEYDEYQQAWRLLGFMIDCDDHLSYVDDDAYYYNNNGGSWDGGTGEGCHRYVLWAAVSFQWDAIGGSYRFGRCCSCYSLFCLICFAANLLLVR